MEGVWKRQKVAAERRKWGIKFRKASGKPDKLRRPGRPWDQAAFAGAEANTFCGGAANLFAYNNGGNDKLRAGSNESIDRIMGKLQLQSYHNQQRQYEALLKPLAENMQAAFQGGKDQVGVADETMEEFNIPLPGHTPRLPTPPQEGRREDPPSPDPYEDPYFQTDDGDPNKMDLSAASSLNYKTPSERAARQKSNTAKKKHRPPVSRLPWQLLDELQAEKDALAGERAVGKLAKIKEMREADEARRRRKVDGDSD